MSSLYRVVPKPSTGTGPSPWMEARSLPGLHRVVGILNYLFGPGTHRIEERRVDAAMAMLDDATRADTKGTP